MTSSDHLYDFKIIDFGLAEILRERSRVVCGTPGYTAPEILNKQLYEFRIDIFSLGVIIYRLYTNTLPFQGKTSKNIIQKNRECLIDFEKE
jgi:serine/threonine protein kinase